MPSQAEHVTKQDCDTKHSTLRFWLGLIVGISVSFVALSGFLGWDAIRRVELLRVEREQYSIRMDQQLEYIKEQRMSQLELMREEFAAVKNRLEAIEMGQKIILRNNGVKE